MAFISALFLLNYEVPGRYGGYTIQIFKYIFHLDSNSGINCRNLDMSFKWCKIFYLYKKGMTILKLVTETPYIFSL